jgi:cell division protein FtsN
MQRSEKFFIFTWKELTVIALLALISMGFFFTLGLHYGKKLPGVVAANPDSHEAGAKLEESSEALPPRETLEQGAQHSGGATEESIKDATQAELKQSDVKLESPKQVDLPGHKKPAEETSEHADHAPETAPESGSETKASGEKNHFAIQLGSYPTKKEAQLKIKGLTKRGVNSEIRTATVNNAVRYRVVVPGFSKMAAANLRGRELVKLKKVDAFIVIKD